VTKVTGKKVLTDPENEAGNPAVQLRGDEQLNHSKKVRVGLSGTLKIIGSWRSKSL